MALKSVSQARLVLFLVVAVTCFFMIYTFYQRPIDGVPTKATWGWKTTEPVPDPSAPRPSFRDLALQYGSHKATIHKYHFMYEKYLPNIRDRPTKLLEIGLGCESYSRNPPGGDSSGAAAHDLAGVGASYHTFVAYFPRLSLTYIERDSDCARDFFRTHDKAAVFVGDQGDEAFLDRFSAESTVHGLFDVVIDDGAGTDALQEKSLRDLWRVVRPGGVYFVEGVRSRNDRSAVGEGQRPFGDFVQELLWEDVMLSDGELRSIDCMEGICAFFKKEEGMP
ncbi:hard-surface induced protein [Sodiomyces alkalinus F11]|uniref:Hard-surface induced protein n=1 Tax=Sodiomyces alkalinus (strain CBS 110278 / VKM F-3762 / F11) TaxID=1314773 RepID=A0A3N2PPR4_SODAK|nr:hard-surface induced protein [Sodiomyces alkalinus F11]ROT36356.1 hard-surface induced protein [Sodiomyces alkalinus F11]